MESGLLIKANLYLLRGLAIHSSLHSSTIARRPGPFIEDYEKIPYQIDFDFAKDAGETWICLKNKNKSFLQNSHWLSSKIGNSTCP